MRAKSYVSRSRDWPFCLPSLIGLKHWCFLLFIKFILNKKLINKLICLVLKVLFFLFFFLSYKLLVFFGWKISNSFWGSAPIFPTENVILKESLDMSLFFLTFAKCLKTPIWKTHHCFWYLKCIGNFAISTQYTCARVSFLITLLAGDL